MGVWPKWYGAGVCAPRFWFESRGFHHRCSAWRRPPFLISRACKSGSAGVTAGGPGAIPVGQIWRGGCEWSSSFHHRRTFDSSLRHHILAARA